MIEFLLHVGMMEWTGCHVMGRMEECRSKVREEIFQEKKRYEEGWCILNFGRLISVIYPIHLNSITLNSIQYNIAQ